MRKLSLLFIALFALIGLVASTTAEEATVVSENVATEAAGTEVASAAEVASLFGADATELDLAVIFSGEGKIRSPQTNVTCYLQCEPLQDQCLEDCGGGIFCDFQCWRVLQDCVAACVGAPN